MELRHGDFIRGIIPFPRKLCSVFTDCMETMMGTKKYISQLCCEPLTRLSVSEEEKGKEEERL